MIGLRTQESDKFLRFWEIVQEKAAEMGKTFFLDCGDGNNYEDDKLECENLTGWLVDNEQTKIFEEVFLSGEPIGDEWSDKIVSLEWEKARDLVEVTFVEI